MKDIDGANDKDGPTVGNDDGEVDGLKDGISDGAELNGMKKVVVSLDTMPLPDAINPPFDVVTL